MHATANCWLVPLEFPFFHPMGFVYVRNFLVETLFLTHFALRVLKVVLVLQVSTHS